MENLKETKNPQVVFNWKAPMRAYKKRGAGVIRFYGALAILLSLIVFFFGSKILLIPIWSLLFLFYVLTITPPPEVENKITRFGIETAGVTVRWESLSYFYFKKRFDYQVLTIVSHPPYYYRLYLVVSDKKTKDKLLSILSEHLIYYEKPRKTFTDKAIDFLTSLVPGEEDFSEKEQRAVGESPQPASL